MRYPGKKLVRKAKRKVTPKPIRQVKRMTNPRNAFKVPSVSGHSKPRRTKATKSSNSISVPLLPSKKNPGCLGIIGIFLILGFISSLFGGGSNSTSSNVSAQSEASQSAISTTPAESPTAVATADSDGQIYDEGSEKPKEENTIFLTDSVATIPADTQKASKSQEALEKLNQLEVKGRAPETGYDRALFGKGWVDTDHNGCDTRNDILRRDFTTAKTKEGTRGCVVTSGSLLDPYTGDLINFTRGRGTSEAVQIDHVVALSDAWQKGAQEMSEEQRIEFANDPINLLAVDGPTNQQKGDGDAATWLPPKKGYRCEYVAKQIDVKAKYGLWVTEAEKTAMTDVLTSTRCGARVETPRPAYTYNPPAAEEPAPAEEAPPAYVAPVAPEAPAPVQYFKNCTEAHAAGRYDIPSSDPAYRRALDGNHDGIACESR